MVFRVISWRGEWQPVTTQCTQGKSRITENIQTPQRQKEGRNKRTQNRPSIESKQQQVDLNLNIYLGVTLEEKMGTPPVSSATYLFIVATHVGKDLKEHELFGRQRLPGGNTAKGPFTAEKAAHTGSKRPQGRTRPTSLQDMHPRGSSRN